MIRTRLLVPVTLAALALAACGSDSGTTAAGAAATTAATAAGDGYARVTTATTAAPATTAAALPADGPETIAVATGSLGPILADGEGHTVYLFTKDSPGRSVCEGDCLVAWPPVVTTGAAVAGAGADAAKLGTLTRADGSTQVTYGGAPLYYFSGDATAGDVNGQGVGGIWFAVKADGTKAG